MRKNFKILILAILIILSNVLVVSATGATVNLNLNSTEVEVGETFTVTLKASCEDGINGLEGKFSYDTEKLEIVGGLASANNKWVNLGTDLDFAVICNSSDTVRQDNILVLTLKVKDTAEIGETAKITVSGIKLDSMAAENSINTIGTKEIEVTIKDAEVVEPDGSEPDGSEPDGSKPDGSKPDGNQSEGKKPDNSVADKPINNAGLENYSFVIIAFVVVIGIISYKKLKAYKNI